MLIALTGADGTYQLSVRDGPYVVLASHADYANKMKLVAVAGKPLEVDFALTPGAVIRGVVIARDTNKPVAHAVISTAQRASNFDGFEATSGDDGAFTLSGAEPGELEISASAPGYASSSPTTVRVGIGEQVDGVRVLVDHAFSISGRVVAKDTRRGKRDVMVGAVSMNGDSGMEPDPTGDDGAFEVFGLKPGTYILFAFGHDDVPNIGTSVTIVDKDVTGVELELDAGVTLSGQIDPPGEATLSIELAGGIGLANAMEDAKAGVVRGQADAGGAWKLEHVPSGSFKLTARTAAGPAGSLPIVVAGADQSGLVVKLSPRASIAGTVIDSDGNPAPGICVRARPADGEKLALSMVPLEHGTATTGQDGAFAIVGLDGGSYQLEAGGDDPLTKQRAPVPVDVADGATKTGVTITIEAKTGVIRGRVVDDHGQPGVDAWVSARPADPKRDAEWWTPTSEPVLTGEDGAFAIRGLAKGAYTIVVKGARGASRAEQKGVNTGDTITIRLAALGTLTGHVTSGGAAVAAFDLRCTGPTGPVERSFASADGSYTLDHLAPGAYECTANSDGGAGSGAAIVPSDTVTLDLALAAWGAVTGTVVSAFDGAPVPGVIAVDPMDQSRMAAAVMSGSTSALQTDSSGRFTVDHLRAGAGRIAIFAPTGGMTPLATAPYTLAAGQRLDLGTIKVVPPRTGDAGTFGMAVANQNGMLAITSIKPGGPADAAGLVAGDLILTIDGRAVTQLGVDPSVTYLSSGSIGIGVTVQLGLARGSSATLTSVAW